MGAELAVETIYPLTYTEREAAMLMGIRPQTLMFRRQRGRSPKFFWDCGRVLYPQQSVEEWIRRKPDGRIAIVKRRVAKQAWALKVQYLAKARYKNRQLREKLGIPEHLALHTK